MGTFPMQGGLQASLEKDRLGGRGPPPFQMAAISCDVDAGPSLEMAF